MRKIYLVRHGQFENPDSIVYGRLPIKLSAEGRAQLERVANYFSDKNIRSVYSSPVLRCRESAQIIAAQLNVTVNFDKRLLEVLTAIQGMKLADYEKLEGGVYQAVAELGGESQLDVQVRMLDCVYDIIKKDHGNSVICSHGDPLYFLVCGLIGKSLPPTDDDFDSSIYLPKAGIMGLTVDGSVVGFDEIVQV